MDADQYLRTFGVEAAKHSGALAHLQKKYAKDILQPGQPGFEQAWGAKRRQAEADRLKAQSRSKAEYQEVADRKKFLEEAKKASHEKKRLRL